MDPGAIPHGAPQPADWLHRALVAPLLMSHEGADDPVLPAAELALDLLFRPVVVFPVVLLAVALLLPTSINYNVDVALYDVVIIGGRSVRRRILRFSFLVVVCHLNLNVVKRYVFKSFSISRNNEEG